MSQTPAAVSSQSTSLQPPPAETRSNPLFVIEGGSPEGSVVTDGLKAERVLLDKGKRPEQAADSVPPPRRNLGSRRLADEGLEEDISTSTRFAEALVETFCCDLSQDQFESWLREWRCPKGGFGTSSGLKAISRNRSAFDPWVEVCHWAERRVGELQREVDKLKMEKDVLEEETRAVADERNELHNQLVSLNVPTKSRPPCTIDLSFPPYTTPLQSNPSVLLPAPAPPSELQTSTCPTPEAAMGGRWRDGAHSAGQGQRCHETPH
ncbi:hypothetical protein BT69DRAFT_1334322 [Atractiella rhizophila]|nr:hypothetical protein BT69DRAFT_1334322 [Atractiella rhizophila]